MANTYLSPGVYVEEVASAMQPIAGVGTNTVGFVGYIPDEIEIPVPLSDDELNKAIQSKLADLRKATGSKDATQKEIEDFDRSRPTKEAEFKTKEQEFAAKEQKLIAEGEAADKNQKRDLENSRKDLERQRHAFEQQKIDIEAKRKALSGVDDQDIIGTLKAEIRPYRLEKLAIDVPEADAKFVTSFSEYVAKFGTFSADDPDEPGKALYPGHRALTNAVYGFFKNGGTRCFVSRVKATTLDEVNLGSVRKALADFESIDAIAIVTAPGLYGKQYWNALVEHAEATKDRFVILDSHPDINPAEDPNAELQIRLLTYDAPTEFLPDRSKNAAFYFPYVEVVDPAKQLQDRDVLRNVPLKHRGKVFVPPSGHVAGIYARVDTERGVFAAPANRAVLGAVDLKYYIGKGKQDVLNPQGVNCIRNLNGNIVVYGARTIGGDLNGEWKYVNVRRTFLFIAESIDEGTQWVVFEPNDRALWGKIKRNVSAFLTNVWRSGALFGSTPEEAFYVKCDDETNPPDERELGRVITEIGVAIVRPAEFVIFRITQATGQKNG